MRSLRVCFAALTAATLLAAGAATAADLKIGVVNMERILRESKTAIEASDRLNAEGQRRQEEIEGISRRFKAEMERDVTRRSREAREEFNQRRNEEVLLLQNRAGRVVQELAKKEQFDLVLYEFFYASDRVDLTSRVIEALDRDITLGKTAKK